MTSLRPMREDEFELYRREATAGYARDMELNGGLPPAAAKEKARGDFEQLLGQAGLDTPGHCIAVVEQEGERVGILWVAERESHGRSALFVYDVQIDERLRGRGLGRAAMLLCEEEARRRGIGRIELNVFGGNEVARRLYRSLGYAEVSVGMGKEL